MNDQGRPKNEVGQSYPFIQDDQKMESIYDHRVCLTLNGCLLLSRDLNLRIGDHVFSLYVQTGVLLVTSYDPYTIPTTLRRRRPVRQRCRTCTSSCGSDDTLGDCFYLPGSGGSLRPVCTSRRERRFTRGQTHLPS